MGFLLMPITTWSLNCLKPEQVSDGSAVTNTARQIAGAVGAPVLVVTMEALTAWRKSGGFSQIDANVWGIQWTLRLSTFITVIMVAIVMFWVKGQGAGSATTSLHQLHEMRRAAKRKKAEKNADATTIAD
jgi:hypothetical protein